MRVYVPTSNAGSAAERGVRNALSLAASHSCPSAVESSPASMSARVYRSYAVAGLSRERKDGAPLQAVQSASPAMAERTDRRIVRNAETVDIPDSTVRRNGLIRCVDRRFTHDGFTKPVTHRADKRLDFLPGLAQHRGGGHVAARPSVLARSVLARHTRLSAMRPVRKL